MRIFTKLLFLNGCVFVASGTRYVTAIGMVLCCTVVPPGMVLLPACTSWRSVFYGGKGESQDIDSALEWYKKSGGTGEC